MISRREFLAASALLGASALSAESGKESVGANINGAFSPISPKPLPFNPKNLNGLSEKLLISHHSNNYQGALKRLNTINSQIAALSKEAPPFNRGSLAREALIASNSVILHELYFENLSGGFAVGSKLGAALEGSFGSVDGWKKDFLNVASSLAGGSGWVVLAYSDRLGALVNVRAESHIEGVCGSTPLLVCDMYEHSYHMDFGADAKSYLSAFLKNVNFAIVEKRLGAIRS